jgi:RHS repeat-associated protein
MISSDRQPSSREACLSSRLAGWPEEMAPEYPQASYYRARYYDATTGRFIGEDPIRFRAGVNSYRYVANNPINRTDPRGLRPTPCKECPSGKWSGAGVNFGGILVAGGVFTGIYRVDCWGGNTSCWIMTTCYGQGLGLGGSVTGEGIYVWGAFSGSDLSGTTDGFLVGGGAGIAAAGGSSGAAPAKNDPYRPRDASSSSSATYGAGVGLGGGYIVGGCTTSVLKCTHH